MNTKYFQDHPILIRVLPFALFLVLTFCQSYFGPTGPYWLYLIKTAAGAVLIWIIRPSILEMRWKFSWEAIVVGIGVFAFWVGLDGLYPGLDELTQGYLRPALAKIGLESWCPKPLQTTHWNPAAVFGPGSVMATMFVVTRIAGSSLVVPPLEEVFFRSFLYRYIAKADFESVPIGRFIVGPFLITSILFGFEHHEWLAGILCAFVYQGLVCWKNRLGDAITAHAITNFLLGLWVVGRGAWHFW